MRAAVLVVTAALALAGCGDDDDGGPSREDFIAEADALCERLNERVEQVNQTQPTNLEELREVLDEGLEVTDEGLEEFEQLEPPEEIEDEVDEFLDEAREQREVLEDAREADSVVEGAQILRDRLPAIRETRRDLADEIGFEECGSG